MTLESEVLKMNTSDLLSIDSSNLMNERNDAVSRKKNLYGVEDKPALAFLILNTIQVVICQAASLVWLPLIQSQLLCVLPADPIRVYLVATALLTSGLLSSLQSTLGVRLPTMVSVSPIISTAVTSLLQSPQATPCPSEGDLYAMGSELRAAEWQERLRNVQGALLLAGVVQTVLGLSGLQSNLCRVLGPVSVAPALVVAGITGVTSRLSADTNQNLLAIVAIVMVLFSVGLRDIRLPLPTFTLHSGLVVKSYHVFRMFPVLWASVTVFLIYKLCSIVSPYPDTNLISFQESIDNSKWFFFPFPFEWGLPIVSLPSVLYLLPALLLQSSASLLLMHADAQVCDVAFPPQPAVSRGLTVEGLGLMLGSMWGQGVAVDSGYIGLTSITGMSSRSCVQLAAVSMIAMSHFPGTLSIFANIPTGFLTAVQQFLHVGVLVTGISILRFVNFDSWRDCAVVGLSIVFGLVIPQWQLNSLVIDTSLPDVDSFIKQVLASPMFIAMLTGCLLDICLPGKSWDRSWRCRQEGDKKLYRLPTWEELLCSLLEQLPFFTSD